MIINGILTGTGRSLGKAGGSNLPIKILTKEEYETMDKQEGVIYIISDEEPADGLIKVTRAEYDALENIEPDKLYVITDEELDDVGLATRLATNLSNIDDEGVEIINSLIDNKLNTVLGEINARLESI